MDSTSTDYHAERRSHTFLCRFRVNSSSGSSVSLQFYDVLLLDILWLERIWFSRPDAKNDQIAQTLPEWSWAPTNCLVMCAALRVGTMTPDFSAPPITAGVSHRSDILTDAKVLHPLTVSACMRICRCQPFLSRTRWMETGMNFSQHTPQSPNTLVCTCETNWNGFEVFSCCYWRLPIPDPVWLSFLSRCATLSSLCGSTTAREVHFRGRIGGL